MNLAMIEKMKEYFDTINGDNQLEQLKKYDIKQKSLVDSEKIYLNEEKINNLYVSLFTLIQVRVGWE